MFNLRSLPRSAVAALLVLPLLLTACPPVGAGGERATSGQLNPAAISFPGTSNGTVVVTANGKWQLSPSAEWLTVSPRAGGAGSHEVSITVNRRGLTPELHGAALTLLGRGELDSVPVTMRFPQLTGYLQDFGVGLRSAAVAGTTGAPGAARDTSSDVPGEYLVLLDGDMAGYLEAGVLQGNDVRPSAVTGTPNLEAFSMVARALAVEHGVSVKSRIRSAEFPLMLIAATPEDAARLATDGRVKIIEPNWRWTLPTVEAQLGPLSHDFGRQWHYDKINLGEAREATQGSPEVVVAVIDGGFGTDHSFLQDALLPGYDFHTRTYGADASFTCAAHGTHVAGTVAALHDAVHNAVGVAPSVKVLPLRIGFVANGKCNLDGDVLIDALLYAAGIEVDGLPPRAPVDVINLSLGGSSVPESLRLAVDEVLARGVTVVAAAGNAGSRGVMYPAAYPGVLAVSGTDFSDRLAYYSNYGEGLFIAAPGGDLRVDSNGDGWPDGILSAGWTDGGSAEAWVLMQGTSMASPHVAGVVALMRSVAPALSPRAVQEILACSAKDIGPPGWDEQFGYGLLDAGAALAAAGKAAGAGLGEYTVSLSKDGQVVASSGTGSGGAFDLGQVEAGSYLLEVTLDPASAGGPYALVPVSVTYDGDVMKMVELELCGGA